MSIKHRGYGTSARPTTPVEGQVIFNTDKNILEVFTDSFWYPVGEKADGNAYKYRTIITTGYISVSYTHLRAHETREDRV